MHMTACAAEHCSALGGRDVVELWEYSRAWQQNASKNSSGNCYIALFVEKCVVGPQPGN